MKLQIGLISNALNPKPLKPAYTKELKVVKRSIPSPHTEEL